jgi:hypothetical protein
MFQIDPPEPDLVFFGTGRGEAAPAPEAFPLVAYPMSPIISFHSAFRQ